MCEQVVEHVFVAIQQQRTELLETKDRLEYEQLAQVRQWLKVLSLFPQVLLLSVELVEGKPGMNG